MRFEPYTLLLFLVFPTLVLGQDYSYGVVTRNEMEMTKDAEFPEAHAIVLYRDVKVKIGDYVEVYEKIKILSEEGLDYATLELPYFDVYGLRGNTFNLVDGKFEKTKLTKDNIFTQKVGEKDKLEFKKVTFPKVKSGSVIEINYKSKRGTAANIDLQYLIPIKKMSVEVENLTAATFRILQNPRAFLQVKRKDVDRWVFITTENVPPLEIESYVYDMELYRAKLYLKPLGRIGAPQFNRWGDVSPLLFGDKHFSKQVKPSKIYEQTLSRIVDKDMEPAKKAKRIFEYVRDEIEWTDYVGIYPFQGTKDTFKDKKGDVSDINMMLISMLRSEGISSFPILSSSKENGVHLSASLEAFDYLICGAYIDHQWVLLDAASPEGTFDFIPEYLVNGKGLLMKDTGAWEWIDLTRPKMSMNRVMIQASLDEDLMLSGSVREQKTGYYGIDLRRQFKDTNVEKDSLLGLNIEGLQYTDIDYDIDQVSADVTISYGFSQEDAAEEIGEDIYFSPLFYLSLSENPFKKSVRRFPIDFGHPLTRQFLVTLEVPEGYETSFLPEPLKLEMPEKLGSYSYRVSQQGNKLQMMMKFQVNSPMVDTDYYYELQEFFKRRVEKESEKVVLSPSK